MKIIGVTGNSGAGKTTVCRILNEKHDAYVIDADEIAKEMSKKGNTYLEAIVECFGADILNEQGELNRNKLADIIYVDDEKREKLNCITFAYVVNEIKNIITNLSKDKLVIIDAPLLFESNLNSICDVVIGVIAKDENKINRICNRDNINEKQAKKTFKNSEEQQIYKGKVGLYYI